MATREPMMSSFRTLDGLKPEELLNPPLRTVNFSDSPAVVFVTNFLRWAWNIFPSPSLLPASSPEENEANPSITPESVIKIYSLMTPEEKDAADKIGKEREGDEQVRRWREEITEFYNHVFVDVMGFLPGVQMGVGHFHPPNHEFFEVGYPVDGPLEVEGVRGPVSKVWETHVLIVPAFMGRGVEVRVSRVVDGEEMTLGVLKGGDGRGEGWENECWWVKAGTEVRFHVEGEWDRLEEGVATVLVVGILCMREAEDRGRDEDEEEQEVEISAEEHVMMLMQRRFQEMGADDIDLSGTRMVTVGGVLQTGEESGDVQDEEQREASSGLSSSAET